MRGRPSQLEWALVVYPMCSLSLRELERTVNLISYQRGTVRNGDATQAFVHGEQGHRGLALPRIPGQWPPEAETGPLGRLDHHLGVYATAHRGVQPAPSPFCKSRSDHTSLRTKHLTNQQRTPLASSSRTPPSGRPSRSPSQRTPSACNSATPSAAPTSPSPPSASPSRQRTRPASAGSSPTRRRR